MNFESLDGLFTQPAPLPDSFRDQFTTEEWAELEADPALLAAHRRADEVRRLREAGQAPDGYTSQTHCQGCGPVPIWPGAPARVLGCPWCLVRAQGRPISLPFTTAPPRGALNP